jgi:MFS family permease
MLKVDGATANVLIAFSLLIGTPFFVIFGWLSDKVGRKPIILAGCALAALTFFPLFKGLTAAANPQLAQAMASAPVTVIADPADCSFQFKLTGREKFETNSCDIAKDLLSTAGVSYANKEAPAGSVAQIQIGDKVLTSVSTVGMSAEDKKATLDAFKKEAKTAITAAGYPAKADPAQINKPLVVAILALLVIYVTMVYGPIAAALVELFPSKIRYTSMSLPYHIGNGWFGGFLPTTAFAMVAASGDIYYGLWYPVVIAAATFVLGFFLIPETKDRNIDA